MVSRLSGNGNTTATEAEPEKERDHGADDGRSHPPGKQHGGTPRVPGPGAGPRPGPPEDESFDDLWQRHSRHLPRASGQGAGGLSERDLRARALRPDRRHRLRPAPLQGRRPRPALPHQRLRPLPRVPHAATRSAARVRGEPPTAGSGTVATPITAWPKRPTASSCRTR